MFQCHYILNKSLDVLTLAYSCCYTVYRNETRKLGSTVKLTCGNKTWSEMFYTIWKIDLGYKQCIIQRSDDGRSKNSCKDEKTLGNTSTSESYLSIPNLSISDEGVYKCESAYKGGSENIIYTLSVTGKTAILTGHTIKN